MWAVTQFKVDFRSACANVHLLFI